MIGKTSITSLIALLGLALAIGSGVAQEAAPQTQTQGEISYVSGGVGDSEQKAMEALKPDFNLHLLFAAAGSGAYLSQVPVRIADDSGQILVEAVSQGPYFFAKLPAGTYNLSVEHAGQIQTRSVAIPQTGAVSEGFSWAEKP